MKNHLKFALFAVLFSQVFFVSGHSFQEENTMDAYQIQACGACGKKHK